MLLAQRFRIKRPRPFWTVTFSRSPGKLPDAERNTWREKSQETCSIYMAGSLVSGSSSTIETLKPRLELGKFAKTRNRPKDWRAKTKYLEELVRRVLIHTTCELDKGSARPRKSKIHSAILNFLKAKDTLITFNYDTVIEESMPHGNALWTPKGGYGVGISGITHEWTKKWFADRGLDRTQDSQIKLFKLHGSINWILYKTSKIRLKHRPYVVRSRNGQPVFDEAAIVPPGWHKRVDRSPYSQLWHDARLKLEGCQTLVIIGYSLPETDLIARALFLEVCRVRVAGQTDKGASCRGR